MPMTEYATGTNTMDQIQILVRGIAKDSHVSYRCAEEDCLLQHLRCRSPQ